ncbi:MAG: PqqD family protein [Anaerolineae bacterium]|nr:PqqD family protein [Anaerolineae bacterium]
MHLSDKPQHNPNATHQTVGEEAIIINLVSGAYYSLNDTGTKFWELLDGQRTIADCARLIAAEYEVEAGVVEADLLELAADFKQEGLIVL